MSKRYLLVCEGPSDIAIFEEIARHLGGAIIELSPIVDATSGCYPPHGWTAVKKWCERQAMGRYKNAINLYLKLKKADGLIIQIDSDISSEIKIPGRTKNIQPGDKAWCEAALNHWLGPIVGHPNVHYIVSSHATESWILATYSNTTVGLPKGKINNYEEISSPHIKLISLGYKKDNNGALLKNKKTYSGEKYAKRIIKHSNKVRLRCIEFRKLTQLF